MTEARKSLGGQLNTSVPSSGSGAGVPPVWPAPRPEGPRAQPPATRLASEIAAFTADMRRAVGDLTTAAVAASRQEYEAGSDDGAVTITVDGSPRVTGVRIGGPAGHRPRDLEAGLATAVNRALDAARRGSTEALLGAAGPGLEPLLLGAVSAADSGPGAAARAAAAMQTAIASSADDWVRVTVNGLGTVTSVTLSDSAARGDDQARLEHAAMEAFNAGLGTELGRGGQARAAAARPPGDPRSAGNAVVEDVNRRMDTLLVQLDRIERNLDRAAGAPGQGAGRLR
jgi:DNA-binding protein YbaB